MRFDKIYTVLESYYPELCKQMNPLLSVEQMLELINQLNRYANDKLLINYQLVIKSIYDINHTIEYQDTTMLSNQHNSDLFKKVYNGLIQLIPTFTQSLTIELQSPHVLNDYSKLNKLANATLHYLTEIENGKIPSNFEGLLGRAKLVIARGVIGLDFKQLTNLAKSNLPSLRKAYDTFQTNFLNNGIITTAESDRSQTSTPSSPMITPEKIATMQREVALQEVSKDRDQLLNDIKLLTQSLIEIWGGSNETCTPLLIKNALLILHIQKTSTITQIFTIADESKQTLLENLCCHAYFLSLMIIAHFQGKNEFAISLLGTHENNTEYNLPLEYDDVQTSISEISIKFNQTLFSSQPIDQKKSLEQTATVQFAQQ